MRKHFHNGPADLYFYFSKYEWYVLIVLYLFYNVTKVTKILWSKRLDSRSYDRCRTSVNGTDFKIYDPSPFNATLHSHKFHGPGLRYEMGVAIDSGYIVWLHGPLPCGNHSHGCIFNVGLKKQLRGGENVVADGGYRDWV